MTLFIGLMSGTSMDGVDAALLQTDGETQIVSCGHVSQSYCHGTILILKSAEYICKKKSGMISKDQELNFEIKNYLYQELNYSEAQIEHTLKDMFKLLFGMEVDVIERPIYFNDVIRFSTDLHVQVVMQLQKKYGFAAQDICAIGFHGQTLFHQPQKKISIIMGDGQYLADQTQIPVVNQFRSQDIQSGGQGAPFAPIYHKALAIRDHKMPAVIINCGGIANASIILSPNESDLIAFDTGPGNVLIDRLMRLRTQGKQLIDKCGELGLQGRAHPDLLKLLWKKSIVREGKNYFDLPAPKSLDSRDCILLPEFKNVSLADACRTLAAFTADSMIAGVLKTVKTTPLFWVLSGGGCHNQAIIQELTERLKQKIPQAQLYRAQDLNWENAAIEAELMAYLCARHLKKLPLSFPKTTGVPHPMLGGVYYEPK